MARIKYRFNPESLSYDRIRISIQTRLLQILTFILAISVISTACYLFSGLVGVELPREKKLKRENEQLVQQNNIVNKTADEMAVVLEDLRQRDENIYRTIFQAAPIPKSIREAGFGGTNRYANLEGYQFSKMVIETAVKLDKIKKQIYIQSKSYDEVIALVKKKEEMLACTPAIQPLSNKDLTRTASGFGYRIHPIFKIKMFHYGFDFIAPVGTDVYATGDGVVETVEFNQGGFGKEVVISHGFGYSTRYAHLSGFNVRIGQRVKRGDIIGFVGNTGRSTAAHLHYEVLVNDKQVDPTPYFFRDLTPDEFQKMIQMSTNSNQTFD
jgi:murein DD-endopeptidase MepM/ murein hydrolase activator NlpD